MEAILRTQLDVALSWEASATDEYWTLLTAMANHNASPEELNQLCDAGHSKAAARQALWIAMSNLEGFRQRQRFSVHSQPEAA